MNAPQIIFITLFAVSLLINAYEHGRPQNPRNFWNALISAAIVFGLLIWGGFFR